MEIRSRKEYKTDPDPVVNELLLAHQEALVIYLDQDEKDESESNVRIYTKVRDGSKLLPLMSSILAQTINVIEQERCQHIASETPVG